MDKPVSNVWAPEGGRWAALKNSWKAGEPQLRLFFIFIGSIPIFLFPTGEKAYYKSAEKYGDETWWAPHNLWRELFHFIGGFLIMQLFIFNFQLAIFGMVIIAVVEISNEIFSDIPESGLHFKNILDILFWVSGSLLAFMIAYWREL